VNLPDDVQVQLGYKVAARKEQGGNLSATVKETYARFDLPKAELLQKTWTGFRQGGILRGVSDTVLILAALGIVFFFYLLFCFCSQLICKKAGYEPGFVVWVPVLQLIPLFRAANMSPAWLLACLLPVLNIVAHIVWSVKISRARGKSMFTALLLVLPVTSPLAFLYLAFSRAAPKKSEKKQVCRAPIMTLETA
jgi:hypothetical protein